jgi:hypothetical protein
MLRGYVRTQGWSAIVLDLTLPCPWVAKNCPFFAEILRLRLTVTSYCIVKWRLQRETVELSPQIQQGLGCAGVVRT